ncbi:MAG: rhodanese-like domain-containing protein [Rhizobiaceae bacterium]|nr:rhodanese-like domain-containing protein [Rhizobiaceae bacterium]
MLKTLSIAVALTVLTTSAYAQSNIKKGMTEFSVSLNGETCTIARAQNKGNKIHDAYSTTERGAPQPINLGGGIETLGELEFIDYMMKAEKDDSIMIVDTRTEGWHRDLRIPCTLNVPFTQLNDDEEIAILTILDNFGVEENDDETLNFDNAKTIVGYCNGYWCGQTPGMFVRAKYSLINLGYPAEKLKYYRGGMQAWTSLGLSVEGALK